MKVAHLAAARPYLGKLQSLAAAESRAWQVFTYALWGWGGEKATFQRLIWKNI